MGKRDVICALAADQGVMWMKPSTGSKLDCALNIATESNDIDLVKTLLSHTQRSTVSEDMKVQTETVVRGIRTKKPIT
ncbi:hypothetical protein J4E91_004381 [Alternaria rosae]|nr:hypothetical protein J4E91_004381 [Alternaria rosae]